MKDRSCVMAHSVSKLCSRHPTHRGQCQRCFNCFTKACCQRLNYEHSIPHYERLDSRLMHAASQHAAMLDLPRLLKRIGIHLSTSPHESVRTIICLCHVPFKVISFAATQLKLYCRIQATLVSCDRKKTQVHDFSFTSSCL